jgi:hypothetical protein
MTPKQAIAKAKSSVLEMFADEGVRDITLEEVRFDADRGHWLITIGFYRPRSAAAAQAVGGPFSFDPLTTPRLHKAFKTVRIDDESESFISIEHRAVEGVDG